MNSRQQTLYRINRAMEAVVKSISYISAGCLIIMALLATANVLTSKIFLWGIPSAVDWGTYLLIPVVFLAAGYNLFQNGLIQVDFLTKHFPLAINSVIGIFSNLIGCAISVIITWRQAALATRYLGSGKVSSFMPMHFYIWPFCVILGLGTALMAIVFLWRIVHILFEKDFAVFEKEEEA